MCSDVKGSKLFFEVFSAILANLLVILVNWNKNNCFILLIYKKITRLVQFLMLPIVKKVMWLCLRWYFYLLHMNHECFNFNYLFFHYKVILNQVLYQCTYFILQLHLFTSNVSYKFYVLILFIINTMRYVVNSSCIRAFKNIIQWKNNSFGSLFPVTSN